jgi:hypothetical protein
MESSVVRTVEARGVARRWDLNWGLLVAVGSCVAFWATIVYGFALLV